MCGVKSEKCILEFLAFILNIPSRFKNGNHSGCSKTMGSGIVINWNNKPTNIKELAVGLNIGFESMVFIDDGVYTIKVAVSPGASRGKKQLPVRIVDDIE